MKGNFLSTTNVTPVYCNVHESHVTSRVTSRRETAVLKKEERWKAFGQWVAETRERSGVSQTEAALKAGMARQQWNRIETGNSGTRYDTVVKIAKVLSVVPAVALLKAGFSPMEDPNVKQEFEDSDLAILFYKQKNLTPEGKAKFKPILEMVDREIDRIEKETRKGRKKGA
jgi:transcriptional regulator with XRE-family HTH domain